MSNIHMNVFHHYTQNGSLPIENNISRGWAILIQEYPALLMLFLDKIRSQKTTNIAIPYPDAEYLVEFQKNTTDFDDAERIIGVALTAEELTDEYNVGNVEVAQDYTPITDISVEYNGTIIIIEVKRNGADCRRQLEEQIKKCKETIKKNNNEKNDVNLDDEIISLTWTNIIEILESYISMKKDNAERLITDYYSNLKYHFPTWFPIEPLAKLSIDDEERVQKRIDMIKQEYAKENSELIFNRQAIPLNYSYATECNIYAIKDLYTHNKKREDCIVLAMWPSDTSGQFRALQNITNYKFAEKRYSTIISDKREKMYIRVLPYIKFCHFNKGIMNHYLDVEEQKNHLKALINLGNEINGKWKRGDSEDSGWNKLLKLIKVSGIYSEESYEQLKLEFQDKFWDTNRSYLTASVGFEVYMYIPYEKAQMIDNSKQNSEFLEIIKEYIEKIDQFIRE